MNLWQDNIGKTNDDEYAKFAFSNFDNSVDIDTDDEEFENGNGFDITEIDFSNLSGSSKEKFKKIKRKTSTAKVIKKKQRLEKPTAKTKRIIAEKNVEYDFKQRKGSKTETQIKLPDNREVLIEGVDKFILSTDISATAVKNIGYYKGEKLQELVLIINNTSPTDLDIQLFNPSSPLDYLYSTSNNLNTRILVAGDNKVSYSDLMFNILANPTLIPNAKFAVAGVQKIAQINQPLTFINKNIAGHEKIFPIQNALNIDIDQQQNDILYWDIQKTLGRVYVPDGMDILSYKVLAGMTVIFGFYYKQVQLKKVFWEETRNVGIL